jgi:hypothetical protein
LHKLPPKPRMPGVDEADCLPLRRPCGVGRAARRVQLLLCSRGQICSDERASERDTTALGSLWWMCRRCRRSRGQRGRSGSVGRPSSLRGLRNLYIWRRKEGFQPEGRDSFLAITYLQLEETQGPFQHLVWAVKGGH